MRRHAKAIVAVSAILLTLAFGAGVASAAPTVVIDPSPTASYTTAHVTGTINPNGDGVAIPYYFEYARDPGTEGWTNFIFGGEISGAEAEGTDPIAVAGDLTGLAPGTGYEVRLTAIYESVEHSSPEPNASFTTLAVPAPVVTLDPVTSVTGTSAHFEGTIEPGTPPGDDPAFEVKWRFDCTPDCPGIEGIQTIPANNAEASIDVEADAIGLDSNTDYEVSLVASNEGGQSSAGPEDFKTLATGPEAISLPVGPVTETTAIIGGWVDPNGSPTTYFLQYATQSDFSDAVSIPASEDASAGSGQSAVPVAIRISDLLPDVDYHFRVVAESGAGSDTSDPQSFNTLAPEAPQSCPNTQFRVGPSALLPDCAAYEKITPNFKNGGDVFPGAVLGGDNVALKSPTSFLAEDPYFVGDIRYFARRTSAGWVLRPGILSASIAVVDFSRDLAREIIQPVGPNGRLLDEETDSAADVYVRTNSGPASRISKGSLGGNAEVPAVYGGQSADGSHIVFETKEQLEAPDDSTGAGTTQVYEWEGDQARVVGILPDQTVDPGGAVLVDGVHERSASAPAGSKGAISADGETIFFQSPDPMAELGEGLPTTNTQLYARIGGASTVKISASQCDPACVGGERPARFQGASEDGERVYFSTAARLLNLDGDETPDLYQYNLGTNALTLITHDCEAADGSTVDCGWPADLSVQAGAQGWGVVDVSDNGRRIFFGAPPNATYFGVVNASSLWLYDEQDGSTRFISPYDSLSGDAVSLRLTKPSVNRITPDGNVFTFVSKLRLTAFDNSAGCGGPCSELYSYVVSTGSLQCVSCSPLATSAAKAINLGGLAGAVNNTLSPIHQPNRISSVDGEVIAFQTSDALVARDTNGIDDVYRWNRGRLSLLSTGTNEAESELAGISSDGSNVFFTTRDLLVPRDTDLQADLYDVRVNGGLLTDHSAPPAACAGDACKGPPSPPPVGSAPTTSSFVGAGNQRSNRRCAKGKVRRNNRCLKKRQNRGKKSVPRHTKDNGKGSR